MLIIGGGIAGILTAYFLHQKGVPYILVEKERICGGTTQNTTAKITYQHNLVYHKLLRYCGKENAKGYLAANRLAFDEFEKLCRNIDCDYEKKDNFIYSLDNRKKLEDELYALGEIGYTADFTESLPLPFKTVGAVSFRNQAQFHPLKFLASVSENLNIYENTFVREMIGNTVKTNRGRIKANKVIVATHFPLNNKHGSYFIKLYQSRSYVLAAKNAPDPGGMYLDENDKGLSFRSYKNLLLVGGGNHRTGKKTSGWAELRAFMKETYPMAEEKYHWAAQDCMSLDDMPYIGQYSKRTHELYVASGFCKWGMTGSMTAAMLLSDMITGRQNDFAPVFDPSRNMIKPQLFINGFESATNLLTPSKKRCPHLGCALKWNSAEHSWDCPCHGSRFSEDGRLLNNPANADLKD